MARFPLPEWSVFTELVDGTGWSAERHRLDAAAFNAWPSKGFRRLAFEIKRSRSDFARELAKPPKRGPAEKYFHECWFVCEPKVCEPAEVPEGWGLMVRATGRNGRVDNLRVVRHAVQRKPEALPEVFVAAVVRQAGRSCVQAQKQIAVLAATGEQISAGQLDDLVRARVDAEVAIQREMLAKREERVQEEQRRYQRLSDGLKAPLEELARYCRRLGLPRLLRDEEHLPAIDDVRALLANLEYAALCRVRQEATSALDGMRKLLVGLEQDVAGRVIHGAPPADVVQRATELHGQAEKWFGPPYDPQQALGPEREAALLLAPYHDFEPTRSVLLRSAANIALNAGRPDEAIGLARIGLAGNPHLRIAEELQEVLDAAESDGARQRQPTRQRRKKNASGTSR